MAEETGHPLDYYSESNWESPWVTSMAFQLVYSMEMPTVRQLEDLTDVNSEAMMYLVDSRVPGLVAPKDLPMD